MKQQHLFAASPVRVNLLGDGGWSETARARHTEPRRVQLQTKKSAPIGAAIRIDAEDALVLAEVRDCTSEGEDFCLSIELLQIIPSVTGLRNLMTAIMNPDGVPEGGDRRASRARTGASERTSHPLAS